MSRSGLLAWCAAGLVGLAAATALVAWPLPADPAWTICQSRRWLGLPCAGCGMTRALSALAHGRWTDALALHPLAPALVLEALAAWIAWGCTAAGLLRPPGPRAVRLLLAGNVLALLGVWVVRLASGTLPR